MPFDESNVRWFELGALEHLVIAMLDVDVEKKTADFMVKFDPNKQIILHRHVAHTNTFVVEGEHRIYEPDGTLTEVRQVGSYTSSPPGAPHREGAGDRPCIVLYSIRGDHDAMFELLNDDGSLAAPLSVHDFLAAWEEQQQAPLATA